MEKAELRGTGWRFFSISPVAIKRLRLEGDDTQRTRVMAVSSGAHKARQSRLIVSARPSLENSESGAD